MEKKMLLQVKEGHA